MIQNGVELFEPVRPVAKAKEAAKRAWGDRCVLSGRSRAEIIRDGDSLDGAHLYPAGRSRFIHLACIPGNIFPMSRSDHRQWDTLEIYEKIETLVEHCHHENRAAIVAIVEELGRRI